MPRIIGKILFVVGLLMTTGGILWGWREGVFNFSRMGAGIGLARIFLFFLYMPITVGIAVAGCILLFKGRIARNNLMKRSGLVISFLLFVLALSLGVSNVTSNIQNYGKDGLLWVLMLNLVFASPMFLLSGLFFFLSRIKTDNGSTDY